MEQLVEEQERTTLSMLLFMGDSKRALFCSAIELMVLDFVGAQRTHRNSLMFTGHFNEDIQRERLHV